MFPQRLTSRLAAGSAFPVPGLLPFTRRPLLAAPRASLLVFAALLLALAGCATAPTAYRPPPVLTAAERQALNRQVFDAAWELVHDKFFDAAFRGIDWPAMKTRYRPEAVTAADDDQLYGVLNRMLGELKESHLAALSPKSAHELRTQHRAAVGMRWRLLDGRRVVTDLVPGSPAELGGVQRGWIVVTRDGHPIADEPVFTNEVGKRVTYGFLDADDRPHEVTLTAGLVTFDRNESRVLEGGNLYLRFDRFTVPTLSWLSGELKAHRAAPGVVIDLRQNPGGSTLSLFLMLGEFLDRRAAMGNVIRRNGREHDWKSLRWFPADYRGRIVVLLDQFSASSSEIFAHVLRHHGRASLVGRKSAGAVIVARFYRLPGGGRLEVPVEDYVGLDGQRLEGRGVVPDIEVPVLLADLRRNHDADLAAALRLLQ